MLRGQLQEALQSEIELNEQKAKIITTILHEFRTPLTIINQSTELITKFAERLSDEKIAHLLSNAIKFSEPKGKIGLSIGLGGGALITAVKDNGIGVLEAEKAHIFELFGRGSNIEQRRGIRLGLYIANKIGRRIGGMLSIESAGAGMGTTVIFSLPVFL